MGAPEFAPFFGVRFARLKGRRRWPAPSAFCHPACAALTRWGTPGLDIAAGVVAQLRRAGVRRIDRPGWCTYEDRRFYSHRRDGTTGRIVGAALAAPADGVGQ